MRALPCQPRLDVPNTLHHVTMRGQERRIIFRDDTNRTDCVTRLAALAEAGALLPNHAHL
jgi:REP-associated tyrosine transposase